MSCYRKSKFAFDAFRNFSSKFFPKNLIQDSRSSISHCGHSSTAGKSPNSYGFQSASPIIQKFGRQVVENRSLYNPFLGGSKRFYYVDRYRIQHFKPRGPRRWFQNPRTVLIVVIAGSGVFVTVYYGNLETIPYTKRRHFVLLSRAMERRLGESQFEQMKAAFKGKILPALHPESVRVRLIAKDIIEALQRGLKQENVWSDLGYASEAVIGTPEGSGHETLMALRDSGAEKVEGKWYREDEILDDNWVEDSRKKGQEQGSQANTSHLDGLNWEVLVVNEPVVNAFCLPGGKIVVFTGLLEHFRSDEEIATIIGHEVCYTFLFHIYKIKLFIGNDLSMDVLQYIRLGVIGLESFNKVLWCYLDIVSLNFNFFFPIDISIRIFVLEHASFHFAHYLC